MYPVTILSRQCIVLDINTVSLFKMRIYQHCLFIQNENDLINGDV